MRPTQAAVAALAFIAGCHWAKPAQDPENSDDSESSSERIVEVGRLAEVGR